MSGAFFGDVEAEAGSEQRPCHLWEREEEEGAAAEGVDCEKGGPGEDKVDETEAKTGDEGLGGRGAGFSEDCRGVEGLDVRISLVSLVGEGNCGDVTLTMMLMPHICWAIMTVKEARVARRTRGMVNSSMSRLTYVVSPMTSFSISICALM